MAVEHAHTHGSVEYYTEEKYVEAARATMGSIDTDPATCAEANIWIKALTTFDIDMCGLQHAHQWHGNVWLNPPGGLIKWSDAEQCWIQAHHISEKGAKSSQKVWWCTVVQLWKERRILSATFVSFNLEILRWSQETTMPVQGFPRCYPKKRMRFRQPGTNKSSPAHPNLIAYLPEYDDYDAFNKMARSFESLGLCEPGVSI